MMRLSSSSTARRSTCSSELHPLFAGFAWCYEMGRTLELPSPFVGPRRAKNGHPGGAARELRVGPLGRSPSFARCLTRGKLGALLAKRLRRQRREARSVAQRCGGEVEARRAVLVARGFNISFTTSACSSCAFNSQGQRSRPAPRSPQHGRGCPTRRRQPG